MIQVMPLFLLNLYGKAKFTPIEIIYPNGLSCSMSEELQEPMMRTIPGLERVKLVRPAYGVEYDHIDARELTRMAHSSRVQCLKSNVFSSYFGNEADIWPVHGRANQWFVKVGDHLIDC